MNGKATKNVTVGNEVTTWQFGSRLLSGKDFASLRNMDNSWRLEIYIPEGLVVVDKELNLSGDYFVLCVIFAREKGVIVFCWVEKKFKNLYPFIDLCLIVFHFTQRLPHKGNCNTIFLPKLGYWIRLFTTAAHKTSYRF